MAWLILILAGLFEAAWAVGLKESKGFTRPWISAITVIAMIVSLVLLSIALKTLPLGTAYTIWTGIGAMGTVILGLAFYHESADPKRLVCIGLILAGILGLKLVSPH